MQDRGRCNEAGFQKHMKGDFVMKKYMFAIIVGVGLVAAGSFLLNVNTKPVAAQAATLHCSV